MHQNRRRWAAPLLERIFPMKTNAARRGPITCDPKGPPLLGPAGAGIGLWWKTGSEAQNVLSAHKGRICRHLEHVPFQAPAPSVKSGELRFEPPPLVLRSLDN